jgi:hypothetical protein
MNRFKEKEIDKALTSFFLKDGESAAEDTRQHLSLTVNCS